MMLHSSLSTPVLVLIITLVISNHVTLITSSSTDNSDTDFIKTSCGSTTYPDLCVASLSVYAAKIQTSPRLLALASLLEALKTVRSTSAAISGLTRSRGLRKREAEALTDCAEELTDTADELQRSVGELGLGGGSGPEFRLRMSDIQTWVSAALTDEDTCLDGFSGSSMNGHVKKAVREHVLNVAHMTSNALALVNRFAFDRS